MSIWPARAAVRAHERAAARHRARARCRRRVASSAGGTPPAAASSSAAAPSTTCQPPASSIRSVTTSNRSRIEGLDHRARRGQRDGVLRRAAAGDHGDAHAPGHGVVVVSVVTAWVELADRERDHERLRVRALDVLVEHEAVLRRVGDRLVIGRRWYLTLRPSRMPCASSRLRPRTDGTSIVQGLLARSKLIALPFCTGRAGRRALLGDLADIDLVRAASARRLLDDQAGRARARRARPPRSCRRGSAPAPDAGPVETQ